MPLDDELTILQPEDFGLAELVSKLPEKYRSAIHLYYYEGYSSDEIGRTLKTRPSTAPDVALISDTLRRNRPDNLPSSPKIKSHGDWTRKKG